MDQEVKDLKKDFIAKGGTAEEFEAGRNAALKRGDEIRKRLQKDEEKDVKDLMKSEGHPKGLAKMIVKGGRDGK